MKIKGACLACCTILYPLACPANAEVQWEIVNQAETSDKPIIWEEVPETENTPEPDVIKWSYIKESDSEYIDKIDRSSDSSRPETLSITQINELISNLEPSNDDFYPTTRITPLLSTAEVIPEQTWSVSSYSISPFKNKTGSGNQNYAVNIDYGLTDKIQLSIFYSQADDPLNATISSRSIQPENLWESIGLSTKWQLFKTKKSSLAINSSLESWKVGSGGSYGATNNDSDTPNIFNNSGKRVETTNIIGSLSLPFSWKFDKKLTASLIPGISFLPSEQGHGQGGAGEFYGTNMFFGAGLEWKPARELSLSASITQPWGDGTNNFNSDLKYSKVPIYSTGIKFRFSPIIGIVGQVTNGFGATPATGILTLPSDNRIGYSVKVVINPYTSDIAQRALTNRELSLSLGGVGIETGFVAELGTTTITGQADTNGNSGLKFKYSISDAFEVTIVDYESNNKVPQTSEHARLYSDDGSKNFRFGGKGVLLSPLRGGPFWLAVSGSLGRNLSDNNSGQGYAFGEITGTWQLNSKFAFSVNPKVAWSGVGKLYGLGLGANLAISQKLELLPETIIAGDNFSKTTSTLGLRYHFNDSIATTVYASTAASLNNIGQLLGKGDATVGTLITIKM